MKDIFIGVFISFAFKAGIFSDFAADKQTLLVCKERTVAYQMEIID